MADQFPPDFPTPSRDEIREDYRRDFRYACNNEQSTDEGTQPWIDGSAVADTLVPGYLAFARAAQSLAIREATGEAVNAWLRNFGQPEMQPETSATGWVVVATATGGTTVFAGDELKANGVRMIVSVGKTVLNGGLVSVRTVDTGPSVNLAAGTKVTWTSPRPGCLPDAVIWADGEGVGLLGGRLAESEAEAKERLIAVLEDPPAAGNDAHVRELVRQAGRALGIAIQAVFTYPAVLGPGTTAVTFTVPPTASGQSRAPSTGQLASAEAWVKEQLPGDDSVFFTPISLQDAVLALKVSWRDGAKTWGDLQPWPPIYPGNDAITVRVSLSATSFTLGRASGSYVGVPAPNVGQTLAFYNRSAGVFVRKRILTVAGTGPWAITVDTTADASDTSYQPPVDTRVSPWSDSLSLVVPLLLAEFDALGPGEQVENPFDPGLRQSRHPVPQAAWDSRLSNRVINGVQDQASVLDAQLSDPLPANLPLTPVWGGPGVQSFLFFLRDLAVGAL